MARTYRQIIAQRKSNEVIAIQFRAELALITSDRGQFLTRYGRIENNTTDILLRLVDLTLDTIANPRVNEIVIRRADGRRDHLRNDGVHLYTKPANTHR